jgi:hypothetical protein
MAKLQAIEEAAKKSEVPAAQRKAQGGDWKVTTKDLEAEEHEGKISHPKELAKNNGTKKESIDQDVAECGGEGGMVQLSMQDLIKLVKGLEQGGHSNEPQHHGDTLLGEPGEVDHIIGSEDQQQGAVMDADFEEEFANAAPGDAGPNIAGIKAVTQTGDDLASKGKASPAARAPGNNPLRPVSEEMRTRLQQYYDYVKAR